MKVLFIGVGLVHYYNSFLNKLQKNYDIEVLNLVARNEGHAEAGVFQTQKDVAFKIIQSDEISSLHFRRYPRLASILRQEKPKIIVVTEPYLVSLLFDPRVVWTLKRLRIRLIMKSIPFRVPTDQEVRERIAADTHYLGNLSRMPRWTRKILRGLHLRFMRWLYNRPDAHVCYVDEGKVIYGSYGVASPKIFITRNSPDTDLLAEVRTKLERKKKPVRRPYRIIHVGRLVEWKRVDMLIECIPSVREFFPETELVIIGEGPQKEALQELVKRLGLDSVTQFAGGVYEPEALGEFLLGASLFVIAGMGGLAINDAMAFGLPIICSICDGTEKALVRNGENGYLFQDGDSHDLARVIKAVFSHPQQMRLMSDRSSDIILNNININTVTAEYNRAFRFVLT